MYTIFKLQMYDNVIYPFNDKRVGELYITIQKTNFEDVHDVHVHVVNKKLKGDF